MDITERRREEEALRRSNADLEQFAYAASHDMQEPLRMVGLYAQFLDRKYHDRLDPDADQYIANIVHGVLRMRTLLHDVLAYSQAGAPIEGSTPEPAFESALQAVLLRLKRRIELTGATAQPRGTAFGRGAPQTRRDDIFEKLIENSLEYRAVSPLQIHVGYEPTGATAELFVRDNGIGIEPRVLFVRIFQIFKRLHNYASPPGAVVGSRFAKKLSNAMGERFG